MSDLPPPPGRGSTSSLGPPAAPDSASASAGTVGSTLAPAKPKRRVGVIVAISLLSVVLVAIGAVLALALVQLDRALTVIDDQQRELDDQRELIDQKETFSSAATELMATAAQLDGVPLADIVDTNYLQSLISRGWTHRWNSAVLSNDIDDVRAETDRLATLVSSASEQRASNGSGTFFEKITDQIGEGFVTTSINTVDDLCGTDAWGCVDGEDPLTIHYDHAETGAEPFMTDWLRTGLAYHEYAHVLQFMNPEQTRKAEEAFDGDWETMADCYALTYLDGWKLDHRIWINSYQYWDVSIGYGYTCNSAQRQVIRDWVDSLGYVHAPISQ